MNVTARLEFELAYYDVTVLHVCHYASGTPSSYFALTNVLSRMNTKQPYMEGIIDIFLVSL